MLGASLGFANEQHTGNSRAKEQLTGRLKIKEGESCNLRKVPNKKLYTNFIWPCFDWRVSMPPIFYPSWNDQPISTHLTTPHILYTFRPGDPTVIPEMVEDVLRNPYFLIVRDIVSNIFFGLSQSTIHSNSPSWPQLAADF